jgi:methionyl-tRNA synthetase
MKDMISYGDFEKLDLRVGKIVMAGAPEWSEKLLRFEVDFGEELGCRVIFSGIRQWYKPEDFVGKRYVFVVNVEPKKMGSEYSQGMILLIDTDSRPVPLDQIDQVDCGVVVR